ncbi:OmpA family protein [Flavobacterium sp. N2270]|uniref:OmpA family protein n=1 Tax=Flavobacterium sp. N2270 TaxID=2986831 RepID=UPI002224CE02|nr:OmpA family protein [Flavobacterium sp. N2270]
MKYNYILILFLVLSTKAISQHISLDDDFKKDNRNLTFDKEDFKIYFDKEGMILENKHKENTKWTLINTDSDYDEIDFDIEASVTLIKSKSDEAGYGLVWACYKDNSNYHVVNLNANKQNKLYWYYNEKFTYDLKWTENKNIKNKKENKIKVSRRAQFVYIYINDELVVKSDNVSYYGSKFGFIVDAGTTMKVTKLKITEYPLSIDVVETFDPNMKMEKLPVSISSTEFEETNPIISADGKTIYITRKDCKFNIDSENDDIWFATKDNQGKWSDLKNMGRPLNNKGNNFVISSSPDNNTLLVGNKYAADGINTNGSGVSISSKTIDGWEIPKALEIKDYINKSKYVGYFLSSDNKHLLMAVERDEGLGLSDFFVSFIEDNGTWSKPVHMGNQINTKEDEANPFLAADGKTMYFSSNGHPGYGGYDLFVSKRLDDSWTNWSKPKNLGKVINSSSTELSIFLSAKGDKAYVGKSSDIWEISNTVKQDPVALIKGRVFDNKTKSILYTSIFYNDLKSNKELGKAISDPSTGSYSIVLPYGQRYSFMAEKEGYYAVTENVDLSNLNEYKEITVDLYLNPIEKGQTIRLNNIFFDSGKYDLLSESNAELEKLLKVLKDNKQLTIEIAGHTDAVGADNNNLVLSNNRANAVMNFLISNGISKERLTAKGYGETKFITTNDTEEGKQQNRRVEFLILEM